MTSFITKATVAASVAALLAVTVPASAQGTLTNGPDGTQPNTLRSRGKLVRKTRQPLTVRRSGTFPTDAPRPATTAATDGGINPVTGVLGVGSAVVGLPFQVLGGIFPNPGTPFKGGVTTVRYEGQRDKVAEIDEGWTMAVPVNRSGPVYVVENGDAKVSPLAILGAPIRAVGTLAQTPFKVIGAPFGGTPTF